MAASKGGGADDGADDGALPITAWVRAAHAGDRDAAERLYRAVYGELRRIARAQQARLGDRGTDTTVLVHELYLRLAHAAELTVHDRHHFFSLAARVLRQILVDGARRQIARRRCGGAHPVPLDEELALPMPPREVVALDEALDRLAELDRGLADLVEVHFFGGLSFSEIAEIVGRSERTLRRDWRCARAFLLRELGGHGSGTAEPPAKPPQRAR